MVTVQFIKLLLYVALVIWNFASLFQCILMLRFFYQNNKEMGMVLSDMLGIFVKLDNAYAERSISIALSFLSLVILLF